MASNKSDPSASFIKSLFAGQLQERWLWPYPTLRTEEQELLPAMLQTLREFCQRHIDSATIDREAHFPETAIQALKELGFFGLNIPAQYGGIGLSSTGYARLMEEIGGVDCSLGTLLGAHHSIGLKGLLLFGTEEQKQRYLPKLATGEMIAAFALTEASAGSDAAQLQMKAMPQADGSYALTGTKFWISNGALADFFTVFAQVPGEGSEKSRITAFLVERAFGVKHGPNEHKLGIRGNPTNALYFEDVRVPAENVLGEVGKGFKIAMNVLNNGRLGMAAITLGGTKRLLQLSTAHASERHAFGKPIASFDQIRSKIASMATNAYALESMVYATTGLIDGGEADYSLEGALCKIAGGETVWHAADDALQVAGGTGFMQDYPYERMLRDARITLIFEGTSEILRNFVALSGLQAAGDGWSEVNAWGKHPWEHRTELTRWAWGRVKSWTGLEQHLSFVPATLQPVHSTFVTYARHLSWQADKVLRTQKERIVDNQFVQVCLANLALELFALAASLARTSAVIAKRGESQAAVEIDLLRSVAHRCVSRMDAELRALAQGAEQTQRSLSERIYAQQGYPCTWLPF